MNRRFKLLFALAAAMLLMLLCTTALAETMRFGTVRGGATVNLRAGMSTSSQWLGSYRKGTWLRIIGESAGWYQVVGPDGKTGYMKKEYVYMSSTAKGVVGIVDVNANETLNLRASASWSSQVIATYPNGVPCVLLSENGEWYHVSVDGVTGYFNASFIEELYTTYSADVATVVTRNGGALNLRKGPGTQYDVVKSVRNGTYVMVIQEGNGWWKVACNGYVGFMDSDYLQAGVVRKTGSVSGSTGTTGGSTSSSNNTSSDGYAVVNNPGQNQKLFLRKAASKTSQSLGAYGNGTYVTVLEQGTVWCKVRVDGQTGYMMTEYLKFYGLSATATATVTHPDKTFVYLRSGPSQSTGAVLMKVPHGARVTVLTPGATWSQVSYNGQTGYMMTSFLQK